MFEGAEGRVVSEYQRRLPGVSDQGIVALMRKQAARIAMGHARTAELIVELRGRPSMAAVPSRFDSRTLTREDLVEKEIRASLGLSIRQAHCDVSTAMALDRRMFATMIMFRAGAISYERVLAIAKHAIGLADATFRRAREEGLSPEAAEEKARAVVRRLEEMVLEEAPRLGRGRLERRLAEAMASIDPRYVESLRVAAVKSRSVAPPTAASDDPGGREMKDLWANLPAPEAQAVWKTVDTYARVMRDHQDERTLDELRADVFTHLILRGHPPVTTAQSDTVIDWSRVAGFDRFGLRANVEVTVSLETLLGISDAPGELGGHGPISAQLARDLAFRPGGTWRRLVTDERGRLIDYGRERYRPPEPLKEYIRGRDRFCRTPWCDRPAATCDTDHVRPFPVGPTAAHNLQSKCRRCHRYKHEGRWAHEVLAPVKEPGYPPGTIRLVSPTGLEYYSEPPNLRRAHQESRAPEIPDREVADPDPRDPEHDDPPF